MSRTLGLRILVGTVSIAVIAALVAAVVALGSPAQQRQRHLDERRERDLVLIANSIVMYVDSHGSLPPDLAALGKQPGTRPAASDPGSGAPYGYSVLAADTYQLCADFAMPSPDTNQRIDSGEWTHRAGHQCFERKHRIEKARSLVPDSSGP